MHDIDSVQPTASDGVSVSDVVSTLELGVDNLARLLGVTPGALERLSAGRLALPADVRPRLRAFVVLTARLHGSFERDDIARWLAAPNRSLNGRSPANLIQEGDVASVLGAIDAVEWGIYV